MITDRNMQEPFKCFNVCFRIIQYILVHLLVLIIHWCISVYDNWRHAERVKARFLENLTSSHLINKFSATYKTGMLMSVLKRAIRWSLSSVPYIRSVKFYVHFNITLPLTPRSPRSSKKIFRTVLYTIYITPMRSTYSANIILLHIIMVPVPVSARSKASVCGTLIPPYSSIKIKLVGVNYIAY
jgi:hypothetical protein